MADQINSIIPEIVRHTIPTSENPVIPSVEISPDKNSETIKSKDSNVVLDKPTPQIDDTLSADEANALLREVVNAPEQVAVTWNS